jgi:hypothetical protein
MEWEKIKKKSAATQTESQIISSFLIKDDQENPERQREKRQREKKNLMKTGRKKRKTNLYEWIRDNES